MTGIATKPNRIPYQIPIAWDAIDLAICVRISITRNIQTSIVRDLGMDAGPIGNLGPEARQETRSMILTMVQDDGVTMIDAIEMVDGEDVEAERVVAMSTSLETQVRPVSLVASLT